MREGAPAFLSLFQPRVSACGRLPSSREVAVSIRLARQEQSEAGWGRPVLQGDQRPSGMSAYKLHLITLLITMLSGVK